MTPAACREAPVAPVARKADPKVAGRAAARAAAKARARAMVRAAVPRVAADRKAVAANPVPVRRVPGRAVMRAAHKAVAAKVAA